MQGERKVLMVKFKKGVTLKEAQKIIKNLELKVKYTYEILWEKSSHQFRFLAVSYTSGDQKEWISKISARKEVEEVLDDKEYAI